MFAAHAGLESVLAGEHTLEEWLVDVEPFIRAHECRLVVVRWPASMDMVLKGHAFSYDLDFCFNEPPYTVSMVEQPGPPSWMSEPR